MAGIEKELRAIMEAEYGEEVRSSIHDAIKAGNEEIIEYGMKETERSQAEAGRAAAENARISAEAGRQRAEVERVTTETMRVEKEAGRHLAEENREKGEAERLMAEAMRTEAEAERAIAEALRQQAEGARATEETARTEAEALRIQTEELRRQAEEARVAAEELREAAKAAMQQATEAANAAAEAAGAYVLGDISNKTVTFTEAETRENLASGESTATLFGKIKKWFADLKEAAFATIANNLTTTGAGSVLDARQGKALDDKLTELNGKLQIETVPVTSNSNGGVILTCRRQGNKIFLNLYGVNQEYYNDVLVGWTNLAPSFFDANCVQFINRSGGLIATGYVTINNTNIHVHFDKSFTGYGFIRGDVSYYI